MARIRTIKPEFFLHEELYDSEAATGLPLRLAFAGLWTQADREGRFVWRPRKLKTQILPYDEIDFSRVLDALATRGFVLKYSVNGIEYGCIPSFSSHQLVNHRESASLLPSPEEADASTETLSTLTRAPRVNDACPTRADAYTGMEGHARGEGKGREGKGKEGKENVNDADASSSATADPSAFHVIMPPDRKPSPPYSDIQTLWNSIAEECGIPQARDLTPSRKQAIRNRWSESSWRANYAEAISRIRGSPFLRGNNNRGWRADFDWFLKPGSVTKIIEGKYDSGTKPDDDMPF